MNEEPLPFKPRDWCVNSAERVAEVRNVYRDEAGNVLLDLWLYDREGNCIGRESPAMGGPRSFEPACDASGWTRIKKPAFPIQLRWVDTEDGKRSMRYWAGDRLGPAKYTPKKRGATYAGADNLYKLALEEIAAGHNDARQRAKDALTQALQVKP